MSIVELLKVFFRKNLLIKIPRENSDFDLGSIGSDLICKQNLLRPYVEMIIEDSILDVGCGDLEVFAPLPASNYTGIDVSEQVISIAKSKRPDWTFNTRNVKTFLASSFDYTFCIDVLTHQPNEVSANELAHNLVRIARKGIIFSVHSKSSDGSGISFNSSIIRDYIDSMPEITTIYEIGSYSNVTLYFAEKGMGERNIKLDIGLQELVVISRSLVDVSLLKEIIAFSRDKIGFFLCSVPRTYEFLWYIEQIGDCSGKNILDLGAGVSFLPFYLTERGAAVTTVDNHPIRRNDQPKHMWSGGWGFFDYSAIDPRIQSFNVDICSLDFEIKYDIVYSAAVIAHMSAEVRRAVMAKISNVLNSSGLLFLTIDLIPGSRLLWNKSEGQIVDAENHGSLDTFKEELKAVGLEILSETSLQGLPMSRTDVGFLVCKKVEDV